MKKLLIILLLIPIVLCSQNIIWDEWGERSSVTAKGVITSYGIIWLEGGTLDTLPNINFDAAPVPITSRITMYYPDSTIEIFGDTVMMLKYYFKEYLRAKQEKEIWKEMYLNYLMPWRNNEKNR